MKQLVHKLGGWYLKKLCRQDFDRQYFVRTNERPIEYGFVFEWLRKLQPKTVLDVGSGTSALPSLIRSCGHLVTAIDNVTDYWPSGMLNRSWWIVDDDIRRTKLGKQFDLVTCISTLEHIVPAEMAVDQLLGKLVAPGGHLILTCPYHDAGPHVDDCYKLPGSLYGQGEPYVCQSFCADDFNDWMKSNRCEIVHQEFWRLFDGQYWTQGNLVRPPEQTSRTESHQLTCAVVKKPA